MGTAAPIPKDLEWTEDSQGDRTTFVLTPSKLGGLPVLIFASLWDAFFVMLCRAMVRTPQTPRFAFLFPLFHAVVGAIVTWAALVRCMNHATLTFGRQLFTLEQAPIPSRGARVPMANVDRFEPMEGRSLMAVGSSWRILMRVKSGTALSLPLPLESEEHAAFVAARLNQALADVRAGV
ncbi:MAG TPA: hypothetical protein VGI39_30055 [Polyangiaceae bacterium]